MTTVKSFVPIIQNVGTLRKTVVDMNGFVNDTYFPREDITFSYYNNKIDNTKPTALFLSGIEFSALSLVQYATDICNDYNLVYVCSGDKSATTDIHDIINVIHKYIETTKLDKIVLIGESTGAVIALNYVISFPSKINSIVILNSATAYKRTENTIRIINFIRDTPEWYYYAAMLLFVSQQKQDILQLTLEDMALMVQMLVNLLLFPKKDLIHRIDSWIIKGSSVIEDRIHEIKCPVTVVSSENDQMFHSLQEAEFLQNIIQNCSVVKVPKCDHLILKTHFKLGNYI